MTAAFYCFLLERSWYRFQANNKPVPGCLAAAFDPSLRVMPVGWQSACGLLPYFDRRLCFLPPPLGAGLDPSRETRRDMPLPRTMDQSRQVFFTVYLDGFSHAELVHISELASSAEIPKEVIKQDEIVVLRARVLGSLGRTSLPRTIISLAITWGYCYSLTTGGS